MKKLTLAFLLSTILFTANAQSKTFKSPDYDAIKKVVQDESSPSYYPKLLDRYQSLDTSLLIEKGILEQEESGGRSTNYNLVDFKTKIYLCVQ